MCVFCVQHEQLWSEREDLMTELETLRNTVRQMEGQTAELHRQTDTLNRDLQAERLLKEQKTKVCVCENYFCSMH